jgi:hypothetical protein
VTSSLVRRPEIFCCVFERPDAALGQVVRGPHAGVRREAEHVGAVVAAEFEQLAAGLLPRAVPRAGDAGDGGQPDGDGAAELQIQRLADALGMAARPCSRAVCQAWTRPRSERMACSGHPAFG